ncbi:phosphoadenosine phosphosulfate reductase family protein [Sphingomonas flavalba]|uniref:phosphoadenosine phosphosulfate reductase domain-containing protein n=1 Tax=Sphingomonas flavalba TaxID=2559804 RepID=UPI0039E12335
MKLIPQISDLDEKIAQSMAIIDQALSENGNVTHLFGLYSSGNDSACSTHLASQHPAFTRAAMIDTTIAIPEAQAHGRAVAELFQWRLIEYRAPVPYRDIVLKHGFAGPGGHRFMYIRLKERCVDRLVREHKTQWRDRIGLVTGVRLSESERRMGHVVPIRRDGCQLWIAPILNWTDDDKIEYMRRHHIPRSPVTDKLCMSGECLCGAFARKEELVEIDLHYPATAARIRALEAEAAAAGVHAKWGTRPPGKRIKPTLGGMLCSSCNQRNFAFMDDAA